MKAPSLVVARASDRPEIEGLHAVAAAADGHSSFGDAVWRDLRDPAPDSTGFIARDPADSGSGGACAYVHVSRSDTFQPRHWTIGYVIRPDRRDETVTRSLLDAALGHIASRGGGQAMLWILGADAAPGATVGATAFRHDRDLLQMRVPLPLDHTASLPPGFSVRDFEPGRDEVDWLRVNNRAFGNHAEQGSWIETTLRRRMSEPWFDPSLFLLAFDETGLAGFNWCRVHDPDGPELPLGEIFVIGVDQRSQGTGLGKALAAMGLARLASRGLRAGMLYVDAANTGAVALYRSLGFAVHRLDRAYRCEVEPT